MIGSGNPNAEVSQRGDLFLLEDKEKCTYTLYQTVETYGQLKPSTEKKIKDKPYWYETETGLYYRLERVGEAPNNELGLDSLLATVASL